MAPPSRPPAVRPDPPPEDPALVAGRALLRSGKLREARELYRQAVAADPTSAVAAGELGLVEHQLGDTVAANAWIERALALAPDNVELRVAQAAMLRDRGEVQSARYLLAALVGQHPEHVAGWQRLGGCLIALGQHRDAIEAFDKVIALTPDHDGAPPSSLSSAHNNRGVCLEALGQLDEALAAYQRAAALAPDNARAQRNTGKLLAERGDLAAALAATRRALHLLPDYALAHNDLGICHERLGDLEAALAAYSRAGELDPGSALVACNLGNLFFQLGQAEPALVHLQRAISLDPRLVEAHLNLATVLARLGQIAAAHAANRHAYEISAGRPAALAAFALSCQKVCDWQPLQQLLPQLEAQARREVAASGTGAGGGRRPTVSPFAALSLPWPTELQAGLSRLAADHLGRVMAATRAGLDFDFSHPASTAEHSRPLRVGYLSANFRNHALSHLMVGVFGLHDRDRVRVYTYSQGVDDGSDYRRRIAADSDVFRDQQGLSHAAIARQIHADGIDILVELHGHTDQHRLEVCALRPAPLVVSYIGFPGVLGADFVDYAVTDAFVTPPDAAQHHREGLLLMPHSYYVTDSRQPIDPTPVSRADCGLPDSGAVFCCFNGTYKIDPVMFGHWMTILGAVPNAVLWLWAEDQLVRDNLRRAAGAAGVDPRRLVFAAHIPKSRHLARLALADLFLDTRLYNAHTTACDALWAGVPVLTCPGETFASRVGASLLRAAELPELIVPDLSAYVAKAIELARNPDELAAARRKLATNRNRCALFDTRRWVRNLERGYRQIWDHHCAGLPVPRITTIA